MKTTWILFFLFLMTLPAFAQPEGYELFWHDEFNGTQLDTTKWRHRGLGPRRGGVVTRDAVLLDGKGHLLITTTILDSTHYFVGMIGTGETFNTKYGYFECRCKFGKKVPWDSFWLQSPTAYVYPPSENGGEIDVVEYYGDTVEIAGITFIKIPHNTFWGNEEGGLDHNGSTSLIRADSVYHTVGVEWTETTYRFYVDGEMKFYSQEGVSGKEEYIILSEEPRSWEGVQEALQEKGLQLPVYDTFTVDYVRVYKKTATPVEKVTADAGEALQARVYPNPFRTVTTLSYTLRSEEMVTVKVYDTAEREVATLVSGLQERGSHSLAFDARHLPPGMYYYRIATRSGAHATGKMMVTGR
jgi:beta-glucanase (GH16 family)